MRRFQSVSSRPSSRPSFAFETDDIFNDGAAFLSAALGVPYPVALGLVESGRVDVGPALRSGDEDLHDLCMLLDSGVL